MIRNGIDRRAARSATVMAVVAIIAWAGGTAVASVGYPTAAKVDYVLGCMASNGQTPLVMQRCSCSIDSIAETIPFEIYERVETILRMREGRGELALLFRNSPALEEEVQLFKQAQIEADLKCF